MRTVRQRLQHIEACRILALVTALEHTLDRFAARYDRDTYREPFHAILDPCSDQQIDVLYQAMLWRSGGSLAGLNVQDLTALLEAFSRHNTGDTC